MVRICEKRKICEMKVKNLDQEEQQEEKGEAEDEERIQCLDTDHGCGCV